jgi:D-beta-D-heptose 7-phosphate kinase/D-beta-D-heptose 1-phosphate adenosyltransferase
LIADKIKTNHQLKRIVDSLKAKGKRIVFTNGCFDLIHYGHAKYLEQAKKKGDILIVAINSDSSVKKIKGLNRPAVPEKQRIRLIAALESVNFVVTFNQTTPLKLIKLLKPHILVKGGDWKTGQIVGKEVVESYQGKVLTIPHIGGFSTSDLIKKIVEKFK